MNLQKKGGMPDKRDSELVWFYQLNWPGGSGHRLFVALPY